MMKWLIFFLISLKACAGFAFEYKVDAVDLLHPSALQGFEISQVLKSHELRPLASHSLRGPLTSFDYAFVDSYFHKTILIKSGLRAPEGEMGILKEKSDLGLTTLHFEIQNTAYVLVALNFSKAELSQVLKPWLKQKSTSGRWNLIMPQANAMGCSGLTHASNSSLQKTVEHIEDREILHNIGKCGAQALEGVKKSAQDSLEFFNKLATNPAALWTEMKTSFVLLKDFALNIKNEIGPILNTLSGLSGEEKAQIACGLTGQLIGTAAQAFISGAALGRALPVMMLKLQQSLQALGKLTALEKMGLKLPQKNKLVSEILRCGL